MNEVPASWEWSTLGELAPYIQRGKSPKYADHSDLPVVNQKCIRWNRLEAQHLKFVHPDQMAAWDAARYIRAGDVLWNSTGTGTVGRAYLVRAGDCTPPKVVDSHVTIIRAASEIDPRYLFSWIRSPAVQNKILNMCDGTTNQIELSRATIAETGLPVAPVAEQERIAGQLDILLARIQACNDRLDATPALLKRFRQAVLHSATRGDLTEPDPRRGTRDWRKSTVEEIAVDVRYGTSKKCTYASAGYGVLRIPNIGADGRIDVSDLKHAEFDRNEVQRLALEVGDLLVIRSNGSIDLVGKCGLVTKQEAGLLFAGYLMRLRVQRAMVHPAYVQLWLSSTAQRRLIEQTAKSTSGVNNLNAEELRSLPIELPSLDEQEEIVHRVNQLFKLADRIEARHADALIHVQRLTPLTLAKAFRGELVPQDPNDEPASGLLARISKQRGTSAAEPKAGQPRRARTPRAPKEAVSMSKSRQDDDVMGQPYLASHLRRMPAPASAEALFKVAELPVSDFYKQLAWEVAQGHVKDRQTTLEPGHATG